MNRVVRLFALTATSALATTQFACATGETDEPSVKTDSGTDGRADTGVGGGGDADVAETTPTKCSPGTKESLPCGKCGTHDHTCQADGTYGAFTTCTGEKSGPFVCAPGDTRKSDCGKCGTSSDTCDDTCGWVPGKCSGEGTCSAGEIDTLATGCTGSGEVKSRTCSATCTWGDYSACTAPGGWKKIAPAPTGFDAREYHTAVWTGAKMIVFGGNAHPTTPAARNDGAIYDLATDTWKKIAAAPASFAKGRQQHLAVWTGTEMIVWGGIDGAYYGQNDGARYDPATDTWKSMATSPLSARAQSAAVWSTTTNEMIVWGGSGGTSESDGASYDPATDKWTALPPSPITGRSRHVMVWSGTQAVIWGGGAASIDGLKDGASYDPKTKTWKLLPVAPSGIDGRWEHVGVWTGTDLLVFGGYGGTDIATLAKKTGARLVPDGAATLITPIDDAVLKSSARYRSVGWFLAGKMFVWSGTPTTAPSAATGGAIYDVATDKWSKLDITSALDPRVYATVVTTGKEAIIWGGCGFPGSGSSCFADGAIHRP